MPYLNMGVFMLYKNTYDDIVEAQNGNKEKMASLVKNNMGLVYSITRRFQGRGFEMEDLNQIGAIGLIKAIKNFDTNYDVRLSTYSVPYILGEIKRYIRDDGKIKVSRSVKELATKISNIKKDYEDKNGRDISVEEIARILQISKEDIVVAMEATSSNLVSSMNEAVYDGNDGKICLGDMLQSKRNEENEITNKLTVEKLINDLNDRDREIILLRYYKGKTQTEVSKKLGISQVQISRIEKKVLCQMRANLA